MINHGIQNDGVVDDHVLRLLDRGEIAVGIRADWSSLPKTILSWKPSQRALAVDSIPPPECEEGCLFRPHPVVKRTAPPSPASGLIFGSESL